MVLRLARIIVPFSMRNEVLEYLHTSTCHPASKQMYLRARTHVYWVGIWKDILKFVKNCEVCNRAKGVTGTKHVFQYPVPERPFDRIHLDILSGFCETSRGNKCLLVCVDALTRYTEVMAQKTKTAAETADSFFRRWVCRYGIPKTLITDSGLEFRNELLNSLCQQLRVQKANVVVYHPASNGLAERTNRKLLEVLRLQIGANEVNWDRGLPQCMWVINSCPHSILKTSPYEALFGFLPSSPFDINVVSSELPEPMKSDFQCANARFKLLRDRLTNMEILQGRECGDTHQASRNVGDKIYIKKPVRKGMNYKLDDMFEGPYEVLRILRAGRVVIQRGLNETRTVTEDQIRKS